MSNDALQVELVRLSSQNFFLKKATANGVIMRVSEKGVFLFYRIGRLSIILDKVQWLAAIGLVPSLAGSSQAEIIIALTAA